jgi:hypothetical protein
MGIGVTGKRLRGQSRSGGGGRGVVSVGVNLSPNLEASREGFATFLVGGQRGGRLRGQSSAERAEPRSSHSVGSKRVGEAT